MTARPSCARSKPRARSAARSLSGVPSIQASVSTLRAVKSHSTAGHPEIGVVSGVLRHFRERRRFEAQIHLDRDRAGERLDHLDQPQPARFAPTAPRPCAAIKRNAARSAETPLDAGPQHLDGDGAPPGRRLDLGAMHLRDRGGRDRRTERAEQVGELASNAAATAASASAWETAASGPAGLRGRGRARCRPRRAASPGTGRASHRPGRAHVSAADSRCRRPPPHRAARSAARGAAPSRSCGGSGGRIDRGRTRPRGRTRSRRGRDGRDGRTPRSRSAPAHSRQPECNATTPPVRTRWLTRRNPPPRSSRQRPAASGSAGSIRRGSDRARRRRPPARPSAGMTLKE